jgi:CRP/FNR family transcriptional regulator, cyclic AMP receptor protein
MESLEKYKEYAKRIKIFNGLQPEEVGDLLKQGEMLRYHKGQTIFHQGQLGSNIFVVWRGTVGIYIDNDLIAKCEVGDAFGEMSALNHRPHTGTASAITDVKCFVLTEDDVNSVLQKRVSVRFLLNIIHILSGHLERANIWNAQLRKKVRLLERAQERTAASTP